VCPRFSTMILIANYGVGNLGSIANMLKKIGVDCAISSDARELRRATKLILPGVGAFDDGMTRLKRSGILPILESRVLGEKVPLLGICLGMQLLGDDSDEGKEKGLGWIAGRSVRFPSNLTDPTGGKIRVPHMGWNDTSACGSSYLFADDSEQRFYFVHSYYFEPEDSHDVAATAAHGIVFAAALHHQNIMGVQFHPEKSHKYGMELLRRFAFDGQHSSRHSTADDDSLHSAL
jgi:glutamine amidotransferase